MEYITLNEKLVNIREDKTLNYDEISGKRISSRNNFIVYNDYKPFDIVNNTNLTLTDKDINKLYANHHYYYGIHTSHSFSAISTALKPVIMNFVSSMSNISNWVYTLYFNLVLIIAEKNNNNEKYFIKSGNGLKINDYVVDFFNNGEGKLKYLLFPFRLGLHYEMDKDLEKRDNVAKRHDAYYDFLIDIIKHEQDLIKDYETKMSIKLNKDVILSDNRKNRTDNIMEDVYALPMYNISIANFTRDLYGKKIDISIKNKIKRKYEPRCKLYIPEDIASITGHQNAKYYNSSQTSNEDFKTMVKNGFFEQKYIDNIRKLMKNPQQCIEYPKSLCVSYGEFNNRDTSMLILDYKDFNTKQIKDDNFDISINDNGIKKIFSRIFNTIKNTININGNDYKVIENKNNDIENLFLLNAYVRED